VDADALAEHQDTASTHFDMLDVDGLLFERLIRRRYTLYITSMRTIPCDSRAEAVLMVDNCSSHVASEIFRLLDENHVKVVTFAPYTTNPFQALDLSFFSVFGTKQRFWME
jgi:hypothetical protein